MGFYSELITHKLPKHHDKMVIKKKKSHKLGKKDRNEQQTNILTFLRVHDKSKKFMENR